MKAALIQEGKGPASSLYWGEVPDPIVSEDEVLIQVKATSLNRADLLQREGKYPPPPGASKILGLDCAGEIIERGAKVKDWHLSQRVMALLPGGGYAEKVAVPQSMLMPIPEIYSFTEATCIPEVFLTAYQVMKKVASFERGKKILIHAGGSGVGTAAIQLAKLWGADQIVVTAGSQEKINACVELGADFGINYKEGPFLDKLIHFCPNGVDLILDFIGAPYLEQNLKALNQDGELVLIAAMGGFKSENFNLLPFLLKRVQVKGTTLRSRDLNYKVQLTQEFWQSTKNEWGKTLKPILDRVFPMTDLVAAHEYMESNQSFGKIVLEIN